MAASLLSCHFSEYVAPHVFAVLSVIRSVLKASIVIRFSVDSVLSVLMVFHFKCTMSVKVHSISSASFESVLRVLIVWFESSGSRSVLGRVMSSVSRTVSGQTPMRGMIEEQSV